MMPRVSGDERPAQRPIAVSSAELDRRRKCVLRSVGAAGCDFFVGLDASTFTYLTGYYLTPNERPFAVLLDEHGDLTLFIPLLKHADISARARADYVRHYGDYPGRVHPMAQLAALVNQSGARRTLLEANTHPSTYGYEGPALSDLLRREWALVPGVVRQARQVKSSEEIDLIRHASDWAVFAQGLLMRVAAAGKKESEISALATGEAMRAIRTRFGAETAVISPLSVAAGFGGQIGVNGTANHLQLALDPTLASGDLMISRVPARVGGYYSDIERTMVCENASGDAAELFKQGLEIHLHALEQIKPGVPASEVDRVVFDRFVDMGLADCWRHHVGHSVGLLEREAPFLDIGTTTILEPGMVVTVEPGLYRDGIGGFRHSDCVLVTDRGAEILTEFPRDLQSLMCHGQLPS